MEREPGLHSLIGVMFSRAWSCSSPCAGLSGAGLVVGAGRVGHGYQACREMICSPHPLPLGPPTVTHGTLVTRSLHCCGTTGGAGLIIRREDILKKNLKENLISNHIYSHKTRFFISRSFLSKFFKGRNLLEITHEKSWAHPKYILHLDEKNIIMDHSFKFILVFILY